MFLYVLICNTSYLWVHAMKAPLWKLEGVASGTHYTPEQLRLPLNTTKGCQGTIHKMSLQNKDQTSSQISTCKYIFVYTSMYAPAEYDSTQLASNRACASSSIAFVRKTQCFLKVLTYPFCQLGG